MKIDDINDVHIIVMGNGSAGRKAFKSVIENMKINKIEDMKYEKNKEFETTDRIILKLDEFDLAGLNLTEEQKSWCRKFNLTPQILNMLANKDSSLEILDKYINDLEKQYIEKYSNKKEKKKTWKKNKFWE